MTSATRILGVLAVSALIVAGCGGTESAETEERGEEDAYDPEAIFRFGVPGMPTSFDPRLSAPADPVFLDVVYESLIKRTPDGELVPGLATEWEFSDDHQSLELTLREGVTFHNGAEFDSEAVIKSLDSFRESGAQATALATIDQVEALGPYSVRIDFTEPSGYMLNVLASDSGIVVEPEALDDPDLGTEPVGTGPFLLTGLQQGSITFDKFEDYWNVEETSIAGIEMVVFTDEPTRLRSVVSGETDGTTIAAGQVDEAEANGLSVVMGPNSALTGMLLNTSASEFDDPLVRQALMHAIDREAISQSLFDGACTPTVQPFSEGFWPHVPELADAAQYYDVERANELLAEAGLADGFSFEVVHGPNNTYQNLAQILQAQLAEVGIDVRVRALEFSQMVEDRRTGNFDATVSMLQAGRPDPSQFIVDFYMPGGGYNAGGYELEGISELLAESRAASEEQDRQGPTQQIFAEVFEAGPPVIPVCGIHWVAALREGVSGLAVPTYGDYEFATVKISG